MNAHKLARLTPLGRARMVRRLETGQSVARVARALDLSTTTVRRWWRRYQTEGGVMKYGVASKGSRASSAFSGFPVSRYVRTS